MFINIICLKERLRLNNDPSSDPLHREARVGVGNLNGDDSGSSNSVGIRNGLVVLGKDDVCLAGDTLWDGAGSAGAVEVDLGGPGEDGAVDRGPAAIEGAADAGADGAEEGGLAGAGWIQGEGTGLERGEGLDWQGRVV